MSSKLSSQRAETVRPPADALYDFRFNFKTPLRAPVSGWKGSCTSPYFDEIRPRILNSMRDLILTTDKTNYRTFRRVPRLNPVFILLFIACIATSAALLNYIIFICSFIPIVILKCYLQSKIRKSRNIWSENVQNNLIVFVTSDLPIEYNSRDPSLVFTLICSKKSPHWWFLRVSNNGGPCPYNEERETLIATSYNSLAAQEASNKEGAKVINATDSAKYSQNMSGEKTAMHGSINKELILEGQSGNGNINDNDNIAIENVNVNANANVNVRINDGSVNGNINIPFGSLQLFRGSFKKDKNKDKGKDNGFKYQAIDNIMEIDDTVADAMADIVAGGNASPQYNYKYSGHDSGGDHDDVVNADNVDVDVDVAAPAEHGQDNVAVQIDMPMEGGMGVGEGQLILE